MTLVQEALRRGAIQKERELDGLAALVRELRPRRLLEIGVEFGGTLWLWCELAADEAQVVAVDVDYHNLRERADQLGADPWYPARRRQSLALVTGRSRDESTLSRVVGHLDGPLDFLFIDGDHSAVAALGDFRAYAPLVAAGGLVAMHDIVGTGVSRAWAEIRQGRDVTEIVDADDSRDYMGIGVVHA